VLNPRLDGWSASLNFVTASLCCEGPAASPSTLDPAGGPFVQHPRAGRYLSGRPLMPSGAHISVPRVRLLLSAGYAKMIPAGKDVDACGAYDPDRIGR